MRFFNCETPYDEANMKARITYEITFVLEYEGDDQAYQKKLNNTLSDLQEHFAAKDIEVEGGDILDEEIF